MKSPELDTSLMKSISSSDSILPVVVVVAGVAMTVFFWLAELAELPVSVVCVAVELGFGGRSDDAVAFRAWAALVAALGRGWSSSAIAASAAFLFLVDGGVVKRGAAGCRQG